MSDFSPYIDHTTSDPSLRTRIRGSVLNTVGLAQRASGARRHLKRGRVHVLCFHTMFADEIEPFRQMVSTLSKHSTFVSFSDAVWRIDSGNLDAPFVAFSFDDGMRNNLRAAAVLEEFGTKGIFYVCPSIVGEKNLHKIEAFCQNRLHGPLVDFLDWADLDCLVRRGHEIGSHTMNHHRLCRLGQDALCDELSTSRLVLTDKLDQGAHFAWPYGSMSDIPNNLGELAKTTGYKTCASAIRGCHVVRSETTPDVLCIRRENVQATWPIEHVLTFLCRSSYAADSESNFWPTL